MRLIWKLLRQHISAPQMLGFFLANLVGMLIVLFSWQFYTDIKPMFGAEDGFIKNDYLIISKRIGAMGTTSTFSEREVADIEAQPFTQGVGAFTSSQYKVSCLMGMDGNQFGTEMFFESVPDEFIDADLDEWGFDEGSNAVPIILPRSYLAIYNFGFAQSRSLPKLSEGIVTMVDLMVILRGDGKEKRLKGRIIGFSSRLNTILVPESFMRWSNAQFASHADASPTRLILNVPNPTDDAIALYIQDHGYQIDEDKLDAGRTTYFLKVVTGLVMAVGLLISLLSFYILTLSIYLLVEKNTGKLENLLLIGYSPARVCLPYQLLTIGMNMAVLVIVLVCLHFLRAYYMGLLLVMFPTMLSTPMLPAMGLGLALFLVVSVLNIIAVRRKVMSIWKN